MTVWFTSDLHLGHAKVIEYCRRPFAHVDEMNDALIKRWNAVVQPDDFVYILGDVALCKPDRALAFIRGLRGHKFLIAGNHDKANRKHYERATDAFLWVKDLHDVRLSVGGQEDQRAILCHYPMLTWNKSHHGAWQLHGHCHGSLKDDPHSLRVDVGVDCHGFAPVSAETVRAIMAKKSFKPVDHHGAT